MSFLKFQGVGITALSGAVPRTVIDNYKYTQFSGGSSPRGCR